MFLLCAALLSGCTKDDAISLLAMQETAVATRAGTDDDSEESLEMYDTTMVLGKQLDNPYSVANMEESRRQLILSGTPSSFLPKINRTHRYVRFEPSNDEELAALYALDSTIVYYEYPLDYEILQNGVSYHDPSIVDSLPTYQYASISNAKWTAIVDSLNVNYTILEDLCILDEDEQIGGSTPIGPIDPIDPINPIPNPGDTTRYYSNAVMPVANIDSSTCDESIIDMLMAKSFELTGNKYDGGNSDIATYGSSKWRPAGVIRAYDDVVGDYIPLEGVRVRARRWFTTHRGTTDATGHYSCDGRFKRPANYSIVWDTRRYNIRDGNVVQAYYNGPKKKGDWNLDINSGKSLRYATIHRAAWRYYYGNRGNLTRPGNSRKENIAYHHKKGNDRLGDYNWQWGMGIWSDIRVYGKDYSDGRWLNTNEIFSTACHELGHAAHYTRAKSKYEDSEERHRESWARFVEYYLTKIEYEELGVYKNLGTYDSTNNCLKPDLFHNWQAWNLGLTNKFYKRYTPLYIDLYDDFNQQIYFKNNKPLSYSNYPNDDIHMPAEIIEQLVFNTTSFKSAKYRLLEVVKKNSIVVGNEYNLTKSNINNLFAYYE